MPKSMDDIMKEIRFSMGAHKFHLTMANEHMDMIEKEVMRLIKNNSPRPIVIISKSLGEMN